MYTVYNFDVFYLGSHKVDSKRKSSAFIYPGQYYKQGVISTNMIGAVTQMPGREELNPKCSAIFKYFPSSSPLASLQEYLGAEKENMVLVVDNQGLYLMDREAAMFEKGRVGGTNV